MAKNSFRAIAYQKLFFRYLNLWRQTQVLIRNGPTVIPGHCLSELMFEIIKLREATAGSDNQCPRSHFGQLLIRTYF